MSKDIMKLDANESAFFNRQLEYIKARTYDTKYKPLKALMLIPVSTEIPQGANQVTYRTFTSIGFAKVIADYAKDFPRVDVYGEEFTVKVKDIGDSYGYSIKEIRAAAYAGTNLNQRRANAARLAIDQKIDKIAWNGDADYNIQGFIDYPGMNEYTVPDGAALSPLWVDKTGDEIIADMNGIVTTIMVDTNGVEIPNTLLLPLEQFNLVSSTRMTDGNTMTILEFFLKNNPYVKTVDWLNELKGAGAGGTDRMIAYDRSPEKVTFELPQPFEQFTAQQEGMEFKVPCMATTAGVIMYYPLSAAYGDGI